VRKQDKKFVWQG